MIEGRDGLLGELRRLLGGDALLTEGPDLEKYESGWRYGQGRALAVARPRTTTELSSLLALCHERGIRIVPQGANTGLVGASNPDGSGEMLVLSLERLKGRLEIDPADRTALVDGGVLLSELNAAAAEHGLFFPIDLGADPSLGGMVATNTGGTRLLRYGDVRHNLLGVEVVLADGTVVDALRRLRKNNTGLDLAQLSAGTFGSFGVVTGAVVELSPLPRQRATAFVGVDSAGTAIALLGFLEREAGELLTAFEAISAAALAPTLAHHPSLRNPCGAKPLPPYSLVVELASTLPESALDLASFFEERLGSFLEGESAEGVTDVFFGRPEEFWAIRHHVSEGLRLEGKTLAFDVSVPRSRMPAFLDEVRQLLAERWPFVRTCDYGHFGDGGAHLNLLWKPEEAPAPDGELRAELQKAIYDLCVRGHGGSYSAEHGVGPHNQPFHDRYTPEPLRALARAIKAHLDPKGILGRARLG